MREASSAAARARGGQLAVKRLRAGTSVTTVGEHEVVLQTLHPHGALAVGTPQPLDTTARHIVNTAAALLSLALEQDRAHESGLRFLRTGVLGLLANGQADLACETITKVWGALPEPPWRVLRFRARTTSARWRLHDRLGAELPPHQGFFALDDDGVVALTSADRVELVATDGDLPVGISEPVAPQDFPTALGQAGLAAEAAESRGLRILRYAEHSGRGLLDLLDPAAAATFAHDLLAPLTDRADLEVSLRAWLENHGHWDRAATRLGVHRHTLRNRITKTAELLGKDLDLPGARAELWLALQFRT